MRPIGIGVAAALLLAALAPAAVLSAPKKAPEISEESRKTGMAEAPAAAQAAGVACQVADARLIGKSADKKTKVSTSFYEVDCAQGMGYVIQAASDATPVAFSCIEANTIPEGGKEAPAPCKLPGNADPKADLAPLLTAAGSTCTPTQVRGIGRSKTSTYVELACQDGSGQVLVASAPLDTTKPATTQNCLMFDDATTNIKCTLTDRAARLSVVDRYATESKNNCAVKDRRFVGATRDGASFFEAACQDGKGYIFKSDNRGALTQTIECAKAMGVLGGCTLTDAREAATEQAGLYTRLAKASGVNCDVEKYAAFPAPPGKDIVELVCKGGAPGGVGVFDSTGKGVVYDCGHSLVAGFKCGLNSQTSASAALTADLRKFDQKTCVVKDSRLAGKTPKGTLLLEVSCTDGYKGYMIEYTATPVNAVAATSCAFAAGCKLPGNT
ncbi:hypothetical protein [Phenylobacterium sp.]|uniref:hypothetical protein n=1 Tax=Phenylobacterium sp. TaxID=1871053 RepID=UPI00273360F7|nr:hypothetical protein [Phenylobacterium sp.]MDP3660392.1 hypothetical protein [Phenylobacterium sp.]